MFPSGTMNKKESTDQSIIQSLPWRLTPQKGMDSDIYTRLESHLNIWPSTGYAYGHSLDGKTVDTLVLFVEFKRMAADRTTLYVPFIFEGHLVNLNNSDKS